MTLKMALRWKNPDASSDINLRFKDVFTKGFLPFEPASTTAPGADIQPVPAVLQVTVSPFVLVNYDGAVIVSDATETLTVSDGQINYIVCRARYRLFDSPILALQVMPQAAYLADPELNWLHVVGVVDLSSGGPYSSVPMSRIFYEARDSIDQQTRSSWREPVATAGLLPMPPADHNRHGDVRLVTSTGSLYWWNETSSLWEVFDEVPLITHRDQEHTNGITGDSSPGTLLPGVTGVGPASAMTIAAVPMGSAYTVNGRLLQTPAVPTSILALSVGALRGLIRVEIDNVGTISASYRASLAGALSINYARIVDISDQHPAGSFSLVFNSGTGALSWDSGPPVVAPVAPPGETRRYRLYRPNGLDWIEVIALNTPAVPGTTVSDSYTVNAPTDFENRLLVGHWFWDGSGAMPLIVGQDKRPFGNLGWPQLATSFKAEQFRPPMGDLRGNMVYSGGACSSLGGLNLRIEGPIVSYVQGQRFVTGGFWSGVAIPASVTRFIYIDDTGTLVISATDPATVFDAHGRPLQFAEVARVVTGGVTFTTIEDRRDPQIIVGNATRDSRVRFTGTASARWNDADTRLIVENSGSTTGVELETGTFRTTENLIEATTGALTFEDTNTASPQALTASGEADLTVLQPGNATPSVLGTMHDLQRAKKFAVGVETGCTPSIGAGTSVDIAAGIFYDTLGRRIIFTSTTNVPITSPVANNVYAIVWDPDLTASGSFKSVNLTAGSGCDIQDLPFAVAVLNGTATAVTLLENTVRFADGQYDRSFVTVSGAAAFDEANFNTLRKAMLHIMCFATTEPFPKEIRVVGNLTEPNTVAEGACIRLTNATGFPWAQPSRFSGVKVVGKSNVNAAPGARPVITWTSTTGPLIDFNATSSDVRGFGFSGVNFNASGTASVTNRNRCLFKNISRGFSCVDATINGNNILSHLVYWTDSVVELGGGVGATSQSAGVLFQRVFSVQSVDNGGDALFFFGDNTGTGAAQVTDINGRLTLLDCVFECDATDVADYLISTDTEVDTDTGEFDIVIDKTTLSRMQRVFNNCDEAHKLITASTLVDFSLGISNGASRLAQITGTMFSGSAVNLTGASDVVGCTMAATCTLTIATTNRITGCDFSLGAVTGTLGSISNSVVNLGLTGILSAPTSSSSAWPSITNSTILKANDNANSNTMLSLASTARCVVTSTQFVYTNTGITSTQPVISLTGATARLFLKSSTILIPTGTRNSMPFVVTVTSTGDFRLAIEDCRVEAPLGFLQVSRAAGSTMGEVHLAMNTVVCGGALPLDMQNSTSGQMNVVNMCGNSFTFSATDPVVNIFHAKDMTITDNVFYHTNGAAGYTFGGFTATEGRQDTAVVKGNSFKGDTGASKCDVYISSFRKATYESNSQSVIDVASTLATTYFMATGNTTFSLDYTIANNQLSCDSNAGTGGIVDALIQCISVAQVSITGNSVYAGAMGANIQSTIIAQAGRQLVCSNNAILGTQNTSGTSGTCSAYIDAQGAAPGDGNVSVTSNVIESSVGGSGTGSSDAMISVQNANSATVAGNAIRSRQNGTSATANIVVDDISFVAIDGNVSRSSQDVTVLATAVTQLSCTGNQLNGNTGNVFVDLMDVATSVSAVGNTLLAAGFANIRCGTASSTEDALVSGNIADGSSTVQGSQLRAESTRTSSIVGNTLRSGNSTQIICGSASGNNGVVSGNACFAGNSFASILARGNLAASATGNTLSSNTSDCTVSAIPNVNNGVAAVASNVLKCESGTATLSCGSPGQTGLMCSITDNVSRGTGQCVVSMSGTHANSKFRDNVHNNSFNTLGIGGGTIYQGGNNAA